MRLLHALLDAVYIANRTIVQARRGGSPSSRRCGGTTTYAALSSDLCYNNGLTGTILNEVGTRCQQPNLGRDRAC